MFHEFFLQIWCNTAPELKNILRLPITLSIYFSPALWTIYAFCLQGDLQMKQILRLQKSYSLLCKHTALHKALKHLCMFSCNTSPKNPLKSLGLLFLYVTTSLLLQEYHTCI